MPRPAKIEVDTTQYVLSHGRTPRGYGSWAFHPDKGVDASSPEIIWAKGTFQDAKKAAVIIARTRGWTELVALT